MKESSVVEKLTRNAKKANRKLNKLVAQATKKMDIDVSSIPTRFIMIGNAGLMTGLTVDDVLMTFKLYGPVDDIIMVPCQSFCFVAFANVEDADRSMGEVHGRKLPAMDKALYLAFVSKVPSILGLAATNFLPPGLILFENAITEEQEQLLLKVQFDSSGNSMKNRVVKHYGYEFLYKTNNVDVDSDRPTCEPIPMYCEEILTTFLDCQYISHRPDQLTINQYQPGQGIPMHVDTHSPFEDEILSISLGSPIVMEFKHPSGEQHGVFLPRRSLLLMTKESRYLWSHGIAPRKTDIVRDKRKGGSEILYRGTRTSYTFRKIRRGPCQCQFPQHCDSQREKTSAPNFEQGKLPDSDADAKKLEDAHVHSVYDEIASHFSNTRHTPWPRVTNFIESLPPGTLLLDLGCGNGKYLGINPSVFKVGCDRSEKLMEICGQRGFQGFCCDAMALPLRSETFDACLCIAVIHHLATVERRVQVLHEIARILTPGGKALIYVWALEQNMYKQASHYVKSSCEKQTDIPTNVPSCVECPSDKSVLPVHVSRTQFEHQDLFVPWHLKSASRVPEETSNTSTPKVFHRYYHVFRKDELEDMCAQVTAFSLKESYYDNGNWCVILEKK